MITYGVMKGRKDFNNIVVLMECDRKTETGFYLLKEWNALPVVFAVKDKQGKLRTTAESW